MMEDGEKKFFGKMQPPAAQRHELHKQVGAASRGSRDKAHLYVLASYRQRQRGQIAPNFRKLGLGSR